MVRKRRLRWLHGSSTVRRLLLGLINGRVSALETLWVRSCASGTKDVRRVEGERILVEDPRWEMWSCELHFVKSTRTQGGQKSAGETVLGWTSVYGCPLSLPKSRGL